MYIYIMHCCCFSGGADQELQDVAVEEVVVRGVVPGGWNWN